MMSISCAHGAQWNGRQKTRIQRTGGAEGTESEMNVGCEVDGRGGGGSCDGAWRKHGKSADTQPHRMTGTHDMARRARTDGTRSALCLEAVFVLTFDKLMGVSVS